mmetsp:Transcript_16705/g.14620  ORF Transcript_16705/g.14620 Transcript_16705/m.14620 type:complete len:104 (-) Transcript_16705:519-830(-)
MCFSYVVTFIEGLYIASATDRDDKIGSPIRKKPNYIIKEEILHYNNDNSHEQKAPETKSHSGGILFMKSISITPQNHFKKIKKRVYDRNLDATNTSWVHAFNS